MSVAAKTHIGLIRKTNEDRYYIDDAFHLYVIADGIGGHAYGEVASRLAVESLVRSLKENVHMPPLDAMRKAFNYANDFVHGFQEEKGVSALGTTLTAAFIVNNTIYIGHVGDSRIYISRYHDAIEQITDDHTYLAELAKHDLTSFKNLQENESVSKKNYLVHAIGPEKTLTAQYLSVELKAKDRILLLTDGVYKYVNPDEMLSILNRSSHVEAVCDEFEHLVLDRGGKDNLTSIVYIHESR